MAKKPEPRPALLYEDGVARCPWPGVDPVYVAYHDNEWGVPEHDSRALFEKLLLDGFQAGLSWITILRKRDNFRRAFDGFEPARIARYTPAKLEKLMGDPGIVRNRQKIEGSVLSARAYLAIEEKQGFGNFLWNFVDGRPLQNNLRDLNDIAAETALSQKMSKALKGAGFKFCGPTIVYAFMQATGLVNDHLVGCHCHEKCARLAEPRAASARS
ncbi:MAG: DNA-3-methyladenine glycosylase I [Rhodoblastus sp.]